MKDYFDEVFNELRQKISYYKLQILNNTKYSRMILPHYTSVLRRCRSCLGFFDPPPQRSDRF